MLTFSGSRAPEGGGIRRTSSAADVGPVTVSVI
jgi:hypothetical protein